MSRRRWLLFTAVAVYVAVIVVLAVRPWTWSGSLATPTGAPTQTVSYRCGAPWGTDYVHGPLRTPYPTVGTPCGQRQAYRVTTVINVGLGLAGLVLVLTLGRGAALARRPTGDPALGSA
jgi:hypothetical protein